MVMLCVTILDSILNNNVKIKFCQASSSEMFGVVTEVPQSETSKSNRKTHMLKLSYMHIQQISHFRDNIRIICLLSNPI